MASPAESVPNSSPCARRLIGLIGEGLAGSRLCEGAGMQLISATDRSIPVTVQARSFVGSARAFDLVVPIDLSLVFKQWGPFPGVRGASNQSGP